MSKKAARSLVNAAGVHRVMFEEVSEDGWWGGGWSADVQGRGDLIRRPLFVVGVAVVLDAAMGCEEVSWVFELREGGRAEREAEVVDVRG